ncbi:MAG: isoprenylcysteine carboxylmethyltransferase family protein [Saprospiraceae bacterium]|nr:isoprenylcysteine carboxylmethyltransferase family protein [Saprospiraceae bacterium]
MNIIGKPSINPLVFFSGKTAGYVIWVLLFLEIFRSISSEQLIADWKQIVAVILTAAGIVISTVGLLNLGDSTRAGLPLEETKLKTHGIYRLSRNPIYLGFNFLSLAAMLLIPIHFVIILGIFNLITHHLIIVAEERFLRDRFGEEYLRYIDDVRRYI